MRLKSIELSNFKKHANLVVNFEDGSNLVAGPNYAGKSTVLQAVLVGLYGNSLAPGVTSNLIKTGAQDFKIVLRLSNNLVVTRSSRDSMIARGEDTPFARGHTAVNAAVAEEMGLDKNAFLKVFTSEQGSPQQLLQMEGSELQRFIESCIGVEQLDEVIKKANRESSTALAIAGEVADRLLDATAVEIAESSRETLKKEIEQLDIDIKAKQESIEADRTERTLLQADLIATQERNLICVAYQSKKDQMVGLEYLETVDLREDEISLSLVREQLRDQHTRGRLIKVKERRERDIADLARTLTPVSDIPKTVDVHNLRASQDLLKSQLKEQADVEQYLSVLAQQETELSKLQSSLVVTIPEFVKTKDLQTTWEASVDQLDSAMREVNRLQEALEHSDCPTCKRPYDTSVCLDELKAQWEAAVVVSADQAEVMAQAKRDLHNAQAHNEAVSLLIKGNEDIDHKIALIQGTIKDYSDRLNRLTVRDKADLEAQLEASVQELKSAEQTNALAEKLLRANDDINHKLNRYKTELDDTITELAGITELDQDSLEQTIERLSKFITQQTKANADVEANNRLLARLKAELGALPKPQVPYVDIVPLQQELNDLSNLIDKKQVECGELSNSQFHVKEGLYSIESALTLHREAHGRFNEYADKAKTYKSVSTILADNRSKIISEAMAVIFKVASEFASVCTEGDLQEVLLADGAISYRENDSIYSKHSASGSQKTLMGLGMKLGLSQLVRSDFNCLLLDEVSADMDPEVSMRCMLALDTFCGQIVSVSHRPMDIAGNIISL